MVKGQGGLPTAGERITRLETLLENLRVDVQELSTEQHRSRDRLHNLEGFAQAYLDTQKVNRAREDAQYRKLGRRIQLGGLLMAVAMFTLTVVTLMVHR